MNCTISMFGSTWQPSNEARVTAFINAIEGSQGSIKKLKLSNKKDLKGFKVYDVTGVVISEHKELNKIPKNLSEHFCNMIALEISRCGLKNLIREDLQNLKNLRELKLSQMEILTLSGDLFEDLKQLEIIELQKNKIIFIDEHTFEGLNKLKCVDLRGNTKINAIYSLDEYKIEKFSSNVMILTDIVELYDIIQVLFYHDDVKKVEHNLPRADTSMEALEWQNDKNYYSFNQEGERTKETRSQGEASTGDYDYRKPMARRNPDASDPAFESGRTSSHRVEESHKKSPKGLKSRKDQISSHRDEENQKRALKDSKTSSRGLQAPKESKNFLTCHHCHAINCIPCDAIHTGETCEEFQANKRKEEEKLSEELIAAEVEAGNAMYCFRCEIPLMKVDGCDYIECGGCKLGICWITRKPRHPFVKESTGFMIDGCHCNENGVKCHPKCGTCH